MTPNSLLEACVYTGGTYLVFKASCWVHVKAKHSLWLHPVLLAMAVLIGMLTVYDIGFEQYQANTQLLNMLLGPATVALAIPLYDNLKHIVRLWRSILLATLSGAMVAALSALFLAKLFGADALLQKSLLVKSVTTPIAVGISESIGADPSLTIGLVLITGTIGCSLAPLIYKLLGIKDERVRGYGLGVIAHGFGTAQGVKESVTAGAFAGLAMTLTGITSALLLPLISPWL